MAGVGAGPMYRFITAGYHAAPTGQTWAWKISVTNAATRLGALITTAGGNGIPLLNDDVMSQDRGVKKRPPAHLILQVPSGATNPIYITWDNNTAPVVGGPGFELNPGQTLKMENAGEDLLRVNLVSGDPSIGLQYTINANSALQLIATAATVCLVTFSD